MTRGTVFPGVTFAPLKRLHYRYHSTVERFSKATTMTSPSTIPHKFLSAGNELGVVAVGFSGGQVAAPVLIAILYKRAPSQLANFLSKSANQA